jgi:hypothetical protein
MGKGAYMFVYNLDRVNQTINGVSTANCMYDNGEDNSNISIWNNQTIPPKSSVPIEGWKNPQYIEANGSAPICCFEQSTFTLDFVNGARVKLNVQTDIVPVIAEVSGNVVCSVNSNSSMDIWDGEAGIGIMILPNPSTIPNQQNYIPAHSSNWMEWLNTKTNGVFFNQPLNMISFPASHDAGMGFTSLCTILAGATETQTQTLDIWGQLNAGIRYFDMRPCVWKISNYNTPVDFYFGHFSSTSGGQGCLGQQLIQALNQVVSFINLNQNEIAILKFSHFCDSDYQSFPIDLQEKLLSTIQQELGQHMYTASPGEKINSVTINSIIQSGKRVICVFSDLDSSLYSPENGVLMFGDLNSNSVIYKNLSPSLLTAIKNRYASKETEYLFGNAMALFLNGWKTIEEIKSMNSNDIQNTLIQELSICSRTNISKIQELNIIDLTASSIAYYLISNVDPKKYKKDFFNAMTLDQQRTFFIDIMLSITYLKLESLNALSTNQLLEILFLSGLISNLDIYDVYSETDNLSIMVADQIDKYNNFIAGSNNNYQKNGMFLFSYTLTQSETDAILAALGLDSVLALANYADNYLWKVATSIYGGPTNQQPPNFVYIDAVNNVNAVSTAIYFNLQNSIYSAK